MKLSLVVVGAFAVMVLGACGDESGDSDTSAADAGVLDVAAAFYPLEYVVAEVGADQVSVTNLTPPGGESHDLELTARDAAALRETDMVVFLDGFAPALDDVVAGLAPEQVLDVATVIDLDEGHTDEEPADEEHVDEDHAGEEPADEEHAGEEHAGEEHAGEEHAGEEHAGEEHAGEEHAGEEHAGEDGHDHGGADPHFWLDPRKYADLADAVAAQLGGLAPDHADDFAANATTLRAELEALDAEFMEGLADCASRDLVTSHTAFNYLAERYGLHQVGIAGLSPSAEPSPGKLAEVTDFVEEHGVTTVFYETLVDPAIAETLAAETGARTAVLDPLEGLTDASPGRDYFEVMRSNLASLRAGLQCT